MEKQHRDDVEERFQTLFQLLWRRCKVTLELPSNAARNRERTH